MADNVLVPQSPSEFSDPNFWKKFFASRSTPFEWYGSFNTLSDCLLKYLKPSDKILQIGCGSSQLASELHDNGMKHVHSIDIDEKVIRQQQVRHKRRSELSFEVASAHETGLENESRTAVVDKGTLDALLSSDATDEQKDFVRSIFGEVSRVLAPLGRYIVISLGQRHILEEWAAWFSKTCSFVLRVHLLPETDGGMPVIALVATKLNRPMPVEMPVELWRSSAVEKGERLTGGDGLAKLFEAVESAQELGRITHLCKKSGPLRDEMCIQLYSAFTGQVRVSCFVVDSVRVRTLKSYALFVVPLGRERSWLFASTAGRQELREHCSVDRLLVVLPQRGQKYNSIAELREEMTSEFADRFSPANVKGPFRILSLDDSRADLRTEVASGTGMQGGWVVEDIASAGGRAASRMLIFNDSAMLEQTEMYIRQNKDGKWHVVADELTSLYHEQMVAALELLPSRPLRNAKTIDIKLAVLGLGAGALPHFMHANFDKAQLECVELDPAVVEVAHRYFDLPKKSSRLRVVVKDALEWLPETDRHSWDAIVFDVADGSSDAEGVSGPPAEFLSESSLTAARDALKSPGLLLVNLVARNKDAVPTLITSLRAIFPHILRLHDKQHVNQVLVCSTTAFDDPLVVADQLKSLAGSRQWVTRSAELLSLITPL